MALTAASIRHSYPLQSATKWRPRCGSPSLSQSNDAIIYSRFFFLLLFYFLFWLCISFETLFYSFRVIVLSDYLSSADIQRAGTHRCIKNRGERIEMFFLFLLPLLLIATTRQTRRRRRQPNVYDPQSSSSAAPSFSTRCQKIIRTYTTQLIQRIVTGCEPHPTPPSPNKNLIRKGKEGKDVDDKTDNGIGRDI